MARKKISTRYAILKVSADAPTEVIRAAYKTLTQKYHPDRNEGNAEAARVMTLINEAYQVLSDSVRRAEHDRWIIEQQKQMQKLEHLHQLQRELQRQQEQKKQQALRKQRESQLRSGQESTDSDQTADAAGVPVERKANKNISLANRLAARVDAVRQAAVAGDAMAQSNLGLMYEKGHGVPQDYVAAIGWYRKAAEQGLAIGQSNLGVMYTNGLGVEKDYVEAVRWYRLAAIQGEAIAQYNLGVKYANGHGVTQDFVEAVRWYQKAAEQGEAIAQYNLGVKYANGQGVPRDFVQAHMWYRLAEMAGDSDARSARKLVESKMTTGQIAQSQRWVQDFIDRE